jgi:hypothetical protein
MGYALRRIWLPQGVATLLWNQWQFCRGMSGNFITESVATLLRNQWQLLRGISGNFRMERVATFARNTQVSARYINTWLEAVRYTQKMQQNSI